MCVVGLILVSLAMVLLAIIAFVKTAVIALPWTLSATVLGTLAGTSLTSWTLTDPQRRWVLACILSIAITFGAGFALVWAWPMEAPPQPQGMENLVELPVPTQEVIDKHFPCHLGIWSLLSGAISALALSMQQRPFDKFNHRENKPLDGNESANSRTNT